MCVCVCFWNNAYVALYSEDLYHSGWYVCVCFVVLSQLLSIFCVKKAWKSQAFDCNSANGRHTGPFHLLHFAYNIQMLSSFFFLRFNFIVLFVHFAFGSPFCCRLLYYIFHSPFHHIALLTSFFSSLCSAFFSFVLSLSKNLFYSHFFSIHSVYFWRISSASWRNSQSGFMCNAFIYSYSSVFSPFSVDLFALIFLLRSLNVRPTFH